MKQLKISWEEFNKQIRILEYEIKNSGLNFDGIYGVPRGGLAIALCLSHSLDLPILMYPTNQSLVVDDISDTGIALQNIKHKKIATLFSTDWTITKPDWSVDIKENKDEWLIFPWENDDKEKQSTIEESVA